MNATVAALIENFTNSLATYLKRKKYYKAVSLKKVASDLLLLYRAECGLDNQPCSLSLDQVDTSTGQTVTDCSQKSIVIESTVEEYKGKRTISILDVVPRDNSPHLIFKLRKQYDNTSPTDNGSYFYYEEEENFATGVTLNQTLQTGSALFARVKYYQHHMDVVPLSYDLSFIPSSIDISGTPWLSHMLPQVQGATPDADFIFNGTNQTEFANAIHSAIQNAMSLYNFAYYDVEFDWVNNAGRFSITSYSKHKTTTPWGGIDELFKVNTATNVVTDTFPATYSTYYNILKVPGGRGDLISDFQAPSNGSFTMLCPPVMDGLRMGIGLPELQNTLISINTVYPWNASYLALPGYIAEGNLVVERDCSLVTYKAVNNTPNSLVVLHEWRNSSNAVVSTSDTLEQPVPDTYTYTAQYSDLCIKQETLIVS